MKLKVIILLSVLMIVWFTCCNDTMAASLEEELGYVPWEVIVRYKDKNDVDLSKWMRNILSIDEELDQDNLKELDKLDKTLNISLLEIEDWKSVEETIKILEKNPYVEYAEPNYIRYFHDELNSDPIELGDPYKNNQWSLQYIDWNDAFMLYSWGLKNTDVVVWIMDNWVNYNHPDLSGSMWNSVNWKCKMKLNGYVFDNYDCTHGYDFVHIASTPLPNDHHHGTHLAWIVWATINNWKWIVWVNPYAKIASLKVWKSTTITTSAEIRAIDFAIENGIKILNASFWSESMSPAEWDAINRYEQFWWLFVTSAWNNGRNIDWGSFSASPCNYDLPNIICVASMDSSGYPADSSNYWKVSVDIAAPWVTIRSTSIKKSNLNWRYSDNFESNQSESWLWWDYYDLWNGTRAYKFQWEMSSNSWNIKLAWKENVSLSFKLKCSLSWENVDLYFVKWNGSDRVKTIVASDEFQTVNMDMYAQYYVDDFSFRLVSGGQGEYCLIDDVSLNWNRFYYDMPDDYYVYAGWTSMAAPHVAALASLVRAINPNLTYSEVKDLILSNWTYNPNFSGMTVSEKYINVKKTLDATVNVWLKPVEWLVSSRTGVIKWNNDDRLEYYYEVLDSNNDVIQSGTINSWWEATTQLEWNYLWRVKSLDAYWNESEFSTGYICEKPVLNESYLEWVFSWYECSTVEWNLNYIDNCSSGYVTVWSEGNGTVSFNTSWVINREVYIRNLFWEESDHLNVYYTWFDSLPTMDTLSYVYTPVISSSTSQRDLWNVISLFWVKDWVCGSSRISVVSAQCLSWQFTLSSNRLYVTAPSDSQWTVNCTITFEDDEKNQIIWNLTYSFDTIQTQTNSWWWNTWWSTWWGGWGWWWGGWGWWWGGWGWWWGWSPDYSCKNLPSNAVANNKSTPKSNTNYSYSTDTSKVCTFQCKSGYIRNEKNGTCDKVVENIDNTTWNTVKLVEKSNEGVVEDPRSLESLDNVHNVSNDFDFSWYNNSNPSSILSNWYTVEFNNAYEFAHRAWITTINSIEKADMDWMLTRIAMAKMLSQYAINVLWKQPDKSKRINFVDVPSSLDKDYNDWVTLAYQLWIMGIWINKFRPYDTVTRAEFGTALSRMLYWTKDWTNNYYSTHLAKLREEWVISNVNPYLKELRWYVMIMLMRSAKK